jgi:ABC-type uncharacterized transport system substrate-binding protein
MKIKVILFLCLFCGVTHNSVAMQNKFIFFYSDFISDFAAKENINGLADALKKYNLLDDIQYSNLNISQTSSSYFKVVKIDTKTQLSGILAAVESFKPNMIFTADKKSFDIVSAQNKNTQYPIVFLGLEYYQYKNSNIGLVVKNSNNISGVIKGDVVNKSLNLFNEFAPAAKNIVIIGDNSELSNMLANEFVIYAGVVNKQIITSVLHNDFATLKSQLLKIKASKQVDGVIVLSIRDLVENEHALSHFKFAQWYAELFKVPEISVDSILVSRGLLANVSFSNYTQGYYAGETASKKLLTNTREFFTKQDNCFREYINTKRLHALQIGIITTNITGARFYVDS